MFILKGKMKKFITDIDLKDKRVIIRLDLNVPIDKKTGKITSIKRLREALPTINYVADNGGKVILMSHLGRVKTAEDRATKSLLPVANELATLLNRDIRFIPQTRGKRLELAVEKLQNGKILLMENTRFEDLKEKAESKNNPELGRYWASLGDVFINDAFGTSHRAHASNVGIASNIPESAIGFLMKKELMNLSKLVKQPERPYVAIIGGAKVSDKITVLNTLVHKVDRLIIGGAMAYTFMAAQGIGVGNSLVENDLVQFARQFLIDHGDKIVLPVDHVIGKEFKDTAPQYNLENPIEIPATFMGLDIGPESQKLIHNYLVGSEDSSVVQARTVFWNGPMGVTEFSNYQAGTKAVVNSVASLVDAFTVVGGGDSVAAIEQLEAAESFKHISTGGGASIQFIEGTPLPGVQVIQEAGTGFVRAIDQFAMNDVSEAKAQMQNEQTIADYTQSISAYEQQNQTNEIDDLLSDKPLVFAEPQPEQPVVLEETQPIQDYSHLSTVELEQSLLEELDQQEDYMNSEKVTLGAKTFEFDLATDLAKTKEFEHQQHFLHGHTEEKSHYTLETEVVTTEQETFKTVTTPVEVQKHEHEPEVMVAPQAQEVVQLTEPEVVVEEVEVMHEEPEMVIAPFEREYSFTQTDLMPKEQELLNTNPMETASETTDLHPSVTSEKSIDDLFNFDDTYTHEAQATDTFQFPLTQETQTDLLPPETVEYTTPVDDEELKKFLEGEVKEYQATTMTEDKLFETLEKESKADDFVETKPKKRGFWARLTGKK